MPERERTRHVHRLHPYLGKFIPQLVEVLLSRYFRPRQHVLELELSQRFDRVLTSPPYPGLIDYHEQHRYAYELLGLDDRRQLEVGAAAADTSRTAIAAYVDGIVEALGNASRSLRAGAPVLIVVNDRRELYPEILERAGLRLEERLRRHVNRRTGRRAGEFFEDVLVARVT